MIAIAQKFTKAFKVEVMLKGNLLAFFQHQIQGNIREKVEKVKTIKAVALKSAAAPIRQTLDLYDANNPLNYFM